MVRGSVASIYETLQLKQKKYDKKYTCMSHVQYGKVKQIITGMREFKQWQEK